MRVISDLIKHGILRPIKTLQPDLLFCTQSKYVWRVSCDFCRVNHQTILYKYPIPYNYNLSRALHNKKIFSKFDLIKAYHKILLDGDSVDK